MRVCIWRGIACEGVYVRVCMSHPASIRCSYLSIPRLITISNYDEHIYTEDLQ